MSIFQNPLNWVDANEKINNAQDAALVSHIEDNSKHPNIDNFETKSYIDAADATKVDKVANKGLSANDLTDLLLSVINNPHVIDYVADNTTKTLTVKYDNNKPDKVMDINALINHPNVDGVTVDATKQLFTFTNNDNGTVTDFVLDLNKFLHEDDLLTISDLNATDQQTYSAKYINDKHDNASLWSPVKDYKAGDVVLINTVLTDPKWQDNTKITTGKYIFAKFEADTPKSALLTQIELSNMMPAGNSIDDPILAGEYIRTKDTAGDSTWSPIIVSDGASAIIIKDKRFAPSHFDHNDTIRHLEYFSAEFTLTQNDEYNLATRFYGYQYMGARLYELVLINTRTNDETILDDILVQDRNATLSASNITPYLEGIHTCTSTDVYKLGISTKNYVANTHWNFAGSAELLPQDCFRVTKMNGMSAGIVPNIVTVDPIPSDEIMVLDQNTTNAVKTTTFTGKPNKLTFYGYGESGHEAGIEVSFKYLKNNGTLKLVLAGRNGISSIATDSSEIFHIAFEATYISDTSISTKIKVIGYTEKSNDFTDRSGWGGYMLSKVVAEYHSAYSVTNDEHQNRPVLDKITELNGNLQYNNNTLIDDNSTLGYNDVGSIRTQTGNLNITGSNTTITLPAPFANTNYVVIATLGDGAQSFGVTWSNKGTTSFDLGLRKMDINDWATSTRPVSWVAIGLKP